MSQKVVLERVTLDGAKAFTGQQACMDSLFGGAKSEPTGEWTEIDLNGISRWQKQDDGAADIIWKSAD